MTSKNQIGSIHAVKPVDIERLQNKDDVREIIVDALFNNNFRVNYAGDLSRFLKEINDKLEITVKGGK